MVTAEEETCWVAALDFRAASALALASASAIRAATSAASTSSSSSRRSSISKLRSGGDNRYEKGGDVGFLNGRMDTYPHAVVEHSREVSLLDSKYERYHHPW